MSLKMDVSPLLMSLIESVKLHDEKRPDSMTDSKGFVQWYDSRAELYEEIGEIVYRNLKDLPF